MTTQPLRRSQDVRPIPPGLLSPRDVYAIAKPLADALRLAMGGGK